MKFITFGIDKERNLIIQFPIFIQTLYITTSNIISNRNCTSPNHRSKQKAHSYTHLQIDKPYIVLTSETYITIRQQELRTCKGIGYEFYCEELFAVKHTNQNTVAKV